MIARRVLRAHVSDRHAAALTRAVLAAKNPPMHAFCEERLGTPRANEVVHHGARLHGSGLDGLHPARRV